MTKHIITAFITVLMLAACAPTIETRGNLVSDTKFKEVIPNVSTRADVEQKWGPPTTDSTLDPNTWYYIGETTAQSGVFEEKVTKRRLICVKFDQSDKVIDVTDINTNLAKNVQPVGRVTPTAGKEYTMFQQFIGNLGKFNPEKSAASRAGP